MKQHRAFPLLAALTLSLAGPLGCTDDSSDDNNNSPPRTVVHVTENITVPTTWTGTNVYVLDTSVTVTAALTIEADAVVKLAEGKTLSIDTNGSIVADASAAAPCLFTSVKDDASGGDSNGDGTATTPAPGDWGYVQVRESGTVFNFCRFMYGGSAMPYTGTLVIANDASVTITNCTFAHNQGGTPDDLRAAALNLSSAGAPTVITGNTFFDNDMPLVINGAFDVDDSNVFQAVVGSDTIVNAYNGIFWGGSYETEGAIAWTNTHVPFVILQNPLSVPVGASLTLGDNVIVKFDTGERIEVSGTLTANATTGILFTSLKDDSAGGDTNGDGALTTAAPGDWSFVNVNADGSIFNLCRFSYGGNAKPYSGTFMVSHQHTVTLTNSTFAHNAGGTLDDNRAAAVNLAGAVAGTVVTGNTFYDNDMPMVINGLVSIDDSNVFHFLPIGASTPLTNKYNGIFMDGTSHAVTGAATWSNTEVAYVMLNLTVLSVTNTGTLTLGDNVIVKLDHGRIDYMGTIANAQGTGVYFTSINDDTLAGDTNGDGTDSTPADGDWAGVNNCHGGCFYETWGNILYATNP